MRMWFRGFLLSFFVMSCRWPETRPLVQHVYPKSFSNRRVEIGVPDGPESIETLVSCATRCLKRQCLGFNFGRNVTEVVNNGGDSGSRVGLCDVRLDDPNAQVHLSMFDDVTFDFYGGFENPLSKYDEFCEPLDSDLSLDCPTSFVSESCSGTVTCDVRSSTFKRRFIVYASKSTTSLLAPISCCSKNDGEQLARIDSATIQGFFCHILHNMCGNSDKHVFTFAIYRYTVLGDPWLYLAEGNPKMPDGYYTNWYKDPGNDRCAQMFSGDPYHFKWVQSTCDLATSKGRKYHCVCEKSLD